MGIANDHEARPCRPKDIYEGRPVAILNRYGHWHVYLDHVLQHNVVFATAENAVAWLTERIDQGIPARLN
jgi:hypothetical protein